MRTLKTLARGILRCMGYEIRRITPHSTLAPEITGLQFEDFLLLFLLGCERSALFFVQIGAHDGARNDGIFECVRQLQLPGLLVEPQREPFLALLENYRDCPNLIFENVAVSHQTGSQLLHTIRPELDFLQYANQSASFDINQIKTQLRSHMKAGMPSEVRRRMHELGIGPDNCIEARMVPTSTFDDLLQKHKISSYSFLQIDAEGFDYEILQLANIPKYRPHLINYEHSHLRPSVQVASWKYLRSLGYRLFTHGEDTTAFQPIVDLRGLATRSTTGSPSQLSDGSTRSTRGCSVIGRCEPVN